MSGIEGTESRHDAPCPRCGAFDYHESTTIDLAFGEEIPCKVCKVCGKTFDYGTGDS